jgi:hypothetical protein
MPPADPGGLRRFAVRSANYVERRARTVQQRLLLTPMVLVDPAAEAAEVVVYFPETLARGYQLTQWLPVMEAVARERPVACVLRSPDTYAALSASTSLPLALLRRYEDVMAYYERGRSKVVLYVNHGQLNFQSLTHRTALHVHLNHGESDKRSSFSNQAKAYDRVFVAGEIAERRYLDNLLEFEPRRLVRVGRPPLDFAPGPALPPGPAPTVLYAPTWEGESADNDWSSVRRLGVPVVEQLLRLGTVRVLYKPHPRIAVSDDPEVRLAHRTIVRLLASTSPGDGLAGHAALDGVDVLAALASADVLVTDVSAVALDHLFLRPDRPIVLTDVRGDAQVLQAATPLAAGSDVVHAGNVAGLGALVTEQLDTDPRRADRLAVRKAYFGDLAADGESTARFAAEVRRLCDLRDQLVAGRLQA